jgi:signal transduction histidine kinase
MKLKNRLTLSYLAMLAVPVLLAFFIVPGICHLFLKAIPEEVRPGGTVSFGVKLSGNHDSYERFIAKQAAADPDRLADPVVLRRLERELGGTARFGLAVSRGGEYIYRSGVLSRDPSILRALSGFKNRRDSQISWRGGQWLVQQTDFYFRDGAPGSIYLIENARMLKTVAFNLVTVTIVVTLAIVVLINFLLTYSVHRSIMRPLQELRRAAEQISEGNLRFTVKPRARDEIGEVAAAFETMRFRLEESIGRQLHAENNRKELLSGISHDLKTPIAAIKGYVEGLIDGVADTPEKQSRYIRTIHLKITALDRLLDQFFLFSKLDLKKLPYQFDVLDLRAYLEDYLGELRFELEPQAVRLYFEADVQREFRVLADREHLQRVLDNIIGNSLKYRDRNKEFLELRLELRDGGNEVGVGIADNGPGIDPAELPFIFERFYRAGSGNPRSGGSGLGLAIAKLIVEDHGGTITAESGLGRGTTIRFSLRKAAGVRST